MFRWIPYAMVRVAMFFVGGVFAALWLSPMISRYVMVIAVVVLAAVYVVLFIFSRWKLLLGIIGLVTIFLMGSLRVDIHTAHNDPNHFLGDSIDFYKVRIIKFSEEKANSWRTEGEVISISHKSRWKDRTGRVLIYFNKKDFTEPFHYGDVLLVRGSPSVAGPPSNPGEFDMQRHLFFKNIYHRHMLRKDQVVLIDSGTGNGFISSAIAVRLWSDGQLKTYVNGKREQATASALVLGVTDGLDDDLLTAYASTGAMHILAVSGLHVSIIYWIILLFGKPLGKLRSGKVILAICSVVILWVYAFVTGWSPSVLRAVMMFTFVALARPWRQSTNIYNTMAASAFCLLVYDPFFIMSVGFQLSYIAVFGIVFLHPLLYRLWEPKHRAWDEVWKVTSVSIAAQIATFPISLLYFHQFPNYFLVANLLVIPASFVVLVTGLAILPLSVVPVVASAAGFLLQWVIYVMNQIVIVIGSLPFALVENIYIDAGQAWLLSAITLGVVMCIIVKRTGWLWLSFVLVIAFSTIDWLHFRRIVDRKHITVYNVRGQTAIDLTHRGRLLTVGDSIPAFQTASNRVRLGVKDVGHPAETVARNGCEVISWTDMTILMIRSTPFTLPRNQKVDFVIVSNNSVRSLTEIASQIKCGKVILDSSNSLYFASRLVDQQVPGGSVHSVLHHGAFQYSF
jgi:competence protein ComEC